jgi:mannitol/fructose-specific phosphotransferase system IIA component
MRRFYITIYVWVHEPREVKWKEGHQAKIVLVIAVQNFLHRNSDSLSEITLLLTDVALLCVL